MTELPAPRRLARYAGAVATTFVVLIASWSSVDTARAADPSAYAAAVIRDRPEAYWRLGDAAGSNDALPTTFGPLASASGSDFGQPGALAGDGDTAMSGGLSSLVGEPLATKPASARSALETGPGRTIEFWLKTKAASTRNFHMDIDGWTPYGSAGSLNADMTTGSGNRLTLAFSYNLNTSQQPSVRAAGSYLIPSANDQAWHLYDLVVGSALTTIYVDGVVIGSVNAGMTRWSPPSLFQISGDTLDEVAVYPRAPASDRIATRWKVANTDVLCPRPTPSSLYAANVLSDAPSAYYRLGDPSRALLDQSSACADGAVQNTAATVPGPLVGDSDGALTGDGVVAMGPADSLPSGGSPRTVELWYRAPTTSAERRYLLDYGSTASGDASFALFLASDGTRMTLQVQNDVGSVDEFPLPFSDLGWHLYDVTYDGNTVHAFADGEPIGAKPMTLNTDTKGRGLYVGGAARTNRTGTYDEVAIYPASLPAEVLRDRYLIAGGRSTAGPGPVIAAPSVTYPGSTFSVSARPASGGTVSLTWAAGTVSPQTAVSCTAGSTGFAAVANLTCTVGSGQGTMDFTATDSHGAVAHQGVTINGSPAASAPPEQPASPQQPVPSPPVAPPSSPLFAPANPLVGLSDEILPRLDAGTFVRIADHAGTAQESQFVCTTGSNVVDRASHAFFLVAKHCLHLGAPSDSRTNQRIADEQPLSFSTLRTSGTNSAGEAHHVQGLVISRVDCSPPKQAPKGTPEVIGSSVYFGGTCILPTDNPVPEVGDMAAIRVNPGTAVGATVETGSGVLPVVSVVSTARVKASKRKLCWYGKGTNGERCGDLVDGSPTSPRNGERWIKAHKASVQGDSGGPVYAYRYNSKGKPIGVDAAGMTVESYSACNRVGHCDNYDGFVPLAFIGVSLGVQVLVNPL